LEHEINDNTAVLSSLALLLVASMAVFAVYKWRQISRLGRVNKWVYDYLFTRSCGMPKDLRINCSNDQLWPVFVEFFTPRTGIRHNLEFSCSGVELELFAFLRIRGVAIAN
jgi:hypothetical protein